jgi:hypothetical protein
MLLTYDVYSIDKFIVARKFESIGKSYYFLPYTRVFLAKSVQLIYFMWLNIFESAKECDGECVSDLFSADLLF